MFSLDSERVPGDVLRDQVAAALAGRQLPAEADGIAKAVLGLGEENRAARALANMFFERLVETWHADYEGKVPLAQFCGFEDLQGYADFVAGRWTKAADASA